LQPYWFCDGIRDLRTPEAQQSNPFRHFTPVQVTDSGNAAQAAISPDGRYLLHVQNEKGKESLLAPQRPTGSDTQILHYRLLLHESAFSPDGNYVYYREATNKSLGAFNLYSVPVLGGTPRLLIKDIDTGVTFLLMAHASRTCGGKTQSQPRADC